MHCSGHAANICLNLSTAFLRIHIQNMLWDSQLRFWVMEFEFKQYAEDLLEAMLQQSQAEHSFCQTIESALGVFLTIKHGYDMQKHVYKSTTCQKWVVTWTRTHLGRSRALRVLWVIYEQNRQDSGDKRRKQESRGRKCVRVQKEANKQERTWNENLHEGTHLNLSWRWVDRRIETPVNRSPRP